MSDSNLFFGGFEMSKSAPIEAHRDVQIIFTEKI